MLTVSDIVLYRRWTFRVPAAERRDALPPSRREFAVPKFFFHVHDGQPVRDTEGTELSNIYEAQAEAVKLSGELLREFGGKFWDGHLWSVDVVDEQGQALFTLSFTAVEHATPHKS